MKIAVVALGKIGLPLAVQFASKGHEVIGVDVQQRVVDLVNQGIEPFPGEAFLQDKLSEVVPAGNLRATTDYSEAIPGADAVVVVVPLFVDDETWAPDFEWMDAATQSLAENLTAGTLVSYETTLPVGTLRNRFRPVLEETSGLIEGKDFWMVFSPERVYTGRIFEDLRKYPKLVGGLNTVGNKKGIEFYQQVLDFDERPDLARENGVWDMGTAEAAEMAKLAETTYRDVNIGLANQFAKFADRAGIDVYKVIDACNSQPFSHIHRPGIAVGGHCIPVYPRLYLSTDPDATIVRTSREANMTMPSYAISLAAKGLEELGEGTLEGKTVVVLGASYRGKVKETAFSGVFETVAQLKQAGATVLVEDPMFNAEELKQYGFDAYTWGTSADVAILQADHVQYLDWNSRTIPGLKVFVDGRNFTDPAKWQGVKRFVIGNGETQN